jgi:hypothetical protein
VGLPAVLLDGKAAGAYQRHRPEMTTLYAVVRDNVETLYAAVAAGFEGAALSPFVRREFDGYLDCGLLCRGFARMKCDACAEQHLVAFSCKGRGFCPSCMGGRMCQTAANLVEHVLPPVPLRQWVLTLPYQLRGRLGFDGKLLGAVARIFVDSVLGWYRRRLRASPRQRAESGAVVVAQRASSDLKLNPHLHVVFLDGVYVPSADSSPEFRPLPRLSTTDVADALQVVRARAARAPDRARRGRRRRGAGLAPAGPELRRRPVELVFDGRPGVVIAAPLSVRECGFSLHAATRAGAEDQKGREALLKYILRPPLATEHLLPGPDGLVRITLKRPFSDGTFAIDLDPLSLLCRLAATVRFGAASRVPVKLHLVATWALHSCCPGRQPSYLATPRPKGPMHWQPKPGKRALSRGGRAARPHQRFNGAHHD